MIDDQSLETMAAQVAATAKKVDDMHGLLFPPPAERGSGEIGRYRTFTVISRVREELQHRRRATVAELAESLNANPSSVRVTLYRLRAEGECVRVGPKLWASMYPRKENAPAEDQGGSKEPRDA
jgi:hypothetical protein